MKKVSLFLLMVTAMFFYACEKDAIDTPLNNNSNLKSDEFADETSMDDIDEEINFEIDYFSGSDDALSNIENSGTSLKSGDRNRYGSRYRKDSCPEANITSTGVDFPKTITIDYGDETILDNGRILSGTIIIELSAMPKTEGATRTVTFESFMVDTVAITGSIHSVFGSSSDSTAIVNASSDMTFTFADGFYINKTSNKVRNWVSGINTPFVHEDDEIHISGSSASISSDGVECSKEITSVLIKKGTCKSIIAGTVEITKAEGITILDYGNGTCDNIATLTTNGEVEEITIGNKGRRKNV